MPAKIILDKRTIAIAAGVVIVLGGSIAGAAYYAVAKKTLYIDKAHVEAPVVTLSPKAAGVLRALYVKEGDLIASNTVVAQVGVELIKSGAAGLVISVNDDIGKRVSPQDTIVSLVDPSQLRVVGEVDEDKGLARIHVGQTASFTIDAFGGRKYVGIVDEVSPTSHQSGVLFNISDKRETHTFDVKVKYDTIAHPELNNGMSARIWIYTH